MIQISPGELTNALTTINNAGFLFDPEADQLILDAARERVLVIENENGQVGDDESEEIEDAVAWIDVEGNNFGDDVHSDEVLRIAAVRHLEWLTRTTGKPVSVIAYGAYRDDENRFDTLTVFTTRSEAVRYIGSMTVGDAADDTWDIAELPVYTLSSDVPDDRRI